MSFHGFKSVLRRSLPRTVFAYLDDFRQSRRVLSSSAVFVEAVSGKKGLEVGGPSPLFRTVIRAYQAIGSLDCVNFSSNTVWEGQIREDSAFRFYSGRFGRQFVADATALNCIASDSYEVLLSSNCLEHVANPLKALAEWRRVLRVGGVLVLVLPKREANFDHRRPITELSHLISDFDSGVDESDLTHISEILALHDLSRDSAAGNFEQFKARSLDNFNNRTLHHHVFDMRLVEAVVREAGFSVVFSAENEVDYFCLASKVV